MNRGRGKPARKGEIGDDVRLIIFSHVPLTGNSTTPLRNFLFIFLNGKIIFSLLFLLMAGIDSLERFSCPSDTFTVHLTTRSRFVDLIEIPLVSNFNDFEQVFRMRKTIWLPRVVSLIGSFSFSLTSLPKIVQVPGANCKIGFNSTFLYPPQTI